MTYDQLTIIVDNINVLQLENSISKNLPRKFSDGSYHEVADHYKTKEHDLDVFNVPVKEYATEDGKHSLASIHFKWKYCPLCKQVRNKSLIGFHEAEKMAYVKPLVEKGEIV